MSSPKKEEITGLLVSWSEGDRAALDQLIPLVTTELRRLARRYLNRESAGHTLQPTALVNELYLRLVDRRRVSWQNRAHFFGFAAQTMRRILVDHARSHRAKKRGSGARKVALDDALGLAEEPNVDLVALDDALNTLATMDERQSRIIELRFFAGLTLEETSEVLSISEATVSRDWASAKAWLYRELKKS